MPSDESGRATTQSEAIQRSYQWLQGVALALIAAPAGAGLVGLKLAASGAPVWWAVAVSVTVFAPGFIAGANIARGKTQSGIGDILIIGLYAAVVLWTEVFL